MKKLFVLLMMFYATSLYAQGFFDGVANDFSEGLASVNKDGKWGFIDKTGKVIIPFIYEIYNPEEFHEGLVRMGKRVQGAHK